MPVDQAHTARSFGVELEVILPRCPSKLPKGGDATDRVVKFLRSHGIQAMTEADLAADPRAACGPVWKVATDDSLGLEMDDFEGVEVISPILSGEAGIQSLRQVATILDQQGFSTNFQTGMHVHHDVGDYDLPAWKRLMANFMIAEPAFDQLVSRFRRGDDNEHARTTRRGFGIEPLVAAFTNGVTIQGIANKLFPGIKDGERQVKLNVNSFAKHGTAEFRQHEGTLDPDRLEHWVRLTQGFVNHSKNSPELLTISRGVTDPIAAWAEMARPEEETRQPLLQRLLDVVPQATRDYFTAVAERTAAEKPLPAWLRPTPRHATPNPMGTVS